MNELSTNSDVRRLPRILYPTYRRSRIFLFCFALGLSLVWAVKGPPSLWEVPINLPSASSDVLVVTAYQVQEMPHGGSFGDGGILSDIVPRPTAATQDRDLSSYDIASEVKDCSFYAGHEECVAERQRARQFIYEHWRLKKRGYIPVDFPCVDCGPVLHFFIEPDRRNNWHIAINLENGGELFLRPNAFEVRYKRANEDEIRRESTTKVLTFLNKSGKEVQSF